MAKRMFFMLVVASAIIAGLGYFKLKQVQAAVKAGMSFQPPPEAITTTVAKQETWPSTMSVVGTMTGARRDRGCGPARHRGPDQVRFRQMGPGRRGPGGTRYPPGACTVGGDGSPARAHENQLF